MGLRIATNLPSLAAQRTLAGSGREMQRSFTQLSSGSRITTAADDAAGLSISENLRSQIRAYSQASRNALDAISMIQTSEGGLGEISNIVTRFRELAVQASSDTVGNDERGFINQEVQQLKNEAERIAQATRFGRTQLLDGTGGQFDFQVDVFNDDFNDRISFNASEQNATTRNLGLHNLDFSTKKGAQNALDILDLAQKQVNGYRANLGAIQNRLTATGDNLQVAIENLSAANSRIRDTDIAESSAELSRNQVLQAASISVLSQANQVPAQALALLS